MHRVVGDSVFLAEIIIQVRERRELAADRRRRELSFLKHFTPSVGSAQADRMFEVGVRRKVFSSKTSCSQLSPKSYS